MTNPFRALLLGILAYIVLKFAVYLLDWIATRRHQPTPDGSSGAEQASLLEDV